MKNKILTIFIIAIFLLSAIAMIGFVKAAGGEGESSLICGQGKLTGYSCQNVGSSIPSPQTSFDPKLYYKDQEVTWGYITFNNQKYNCVRRVDICPSQRCCMNLGSVGGGTTGGRKPTCSVSVDSAENPTKVIIELSDTYEKALNFKVTIQKKPEGEKAYSISGTLIIPITTNQIYGETAHSFGKDNAYYNIIAEDSKEGISCPSSEFQIGVPKNPEEKIPEKIPPPSLWGRLKICIWPGNIKQMITGKLAITPVECAFNYAAIIYGLVKANDLVYHNDIGKCSVETPLPGNTKCTTCNEDPFRICTKERCQILGSCIPVPTDKADQYNCIAGKCDELGLVTFTKGKVEAYIDENKTIDKALTITAGNIRTDLAEIKWNTNSIFLNVTTDKPAQCRWILDKTGASFDEMSDFDDNYFPVLPGGIAGWQSIDILLPGEITRNAEHKIFIKCKNACGVVHEPAYDQNYVQFRLGAKPDQLPPEIIYVDPASNSVVRGDLKTINAQFWLDENGKCKYTDKTMNFTLDWDKMKYFEAQPNFNSTVVKGSCVQDQKCLNLNLNQCARCNLTMDLTKGYEDTNFSDLPPEVQQQLEEAGFSNVTKMFHLLIRCEDTAHNIMTEDDALDYFLMTIPPYNITITKPEKGSQTYDVSPDLEVTSEPRNTECRYRIFQTGIRYPDFPAITDINAINCASLNWSRMWPIDAGFDILHQGKYNETLKPGKAVMCAKCRDQWNIEANDRSDFTVLKDSATPIVIRMYHSMEAGDYLIIETDENATCVYGISDSIKCNYNFTDGNAMTGTNETLHAGYWQLDNLYYIKCVDRWGNYPGGRNNANVCTTVINPYEVPPL